MFGMTPHGIPKEEKILKNTVSRKHHGCFILGWGRVVILVSLLLIDATTKCDQSHEALGSLNSCFRLVLFTSVISETLSLNDNTRPHSNVSKTEDIVPARFMKSCFRTTFYSSVRSFARQSAMTKLHSWCGLQKAFRPCLQRKEGDFVERGTCFCSKVE
jgi:hypothetical protein